MPYVLHRLRSARTASLLLVAAAVLGLLLANSPAAPALFAAREAELSLPGAHLSLAHLISDGLLAVFFFLVAIELKRELSVGLLNSVGKALLPAIAALGGVLVPAGVYLLLVSGSPQLAGGWPIPTATDIAFALGVLALFGPAIPSRVRVFLLALAVLDDLVAIVIIALFFTGDASPPFLIAAAGAVAAFGALSRTLRPRSRWVLARRPVWPIAAALVLLGLLAWYLTYRSGVHATIAGVGLGLVFTRRPAGRVHHLVEPFSNGVVLPLFAFSAAMVAIPALRPDELSPAFWGIALALPVGKLIGIALAGGLGAWWAKRSGREALAFADIVMIAALGGIGFTVSLLMNELAFAGAEAVADEGTLAVLLGSGISVIVAAGLVRRRSHHYAR